ncbi:protein fem-1 homolog A-like [Macrobrachium nipponense]|uniref:protein fem-1 homolog A-like n=1 Tax=Macrobrachium nipponense TaxID=159736 RepID=UPI0030C7C3C6
MELIISALNNADDCVRSKHKSHVDQFIMIVLHFLVPFTRLQPDLPDCQRHTVKKAMYTLVKKGLRNSRGSTPLQVACSPEFEEIEDPDLPMSATPRAEVVNLLLETGSDPSATDNEGNTPLHAIAKNEECPKGIVDALLSRGAHLDARNGQGQTFASLRADQGQPSFLSYHTDGPRRLASRMAGWQWESLLNAATILGHATCVQDPLDYHNANIEGLLSGHLEVVDFLLSKGANPMQMAFTTFNSTPLAAACSHGHFEVCPNLLVAHGACTPLMAASSRGHANIVEYLVSRTDISRMEKIEALSFLEPQFLDKNKRCSSVLSSTGSQRLSLRYVDGALMYPKPDHHLSCPLCDEFGEFTTVQQLEAIENNNNAVYLQSLLVRERILGTDDAGTMRSFRSTGLDYARCGDLKWCINLWLHAIMSRLVNMDPRDSTGSTLLHLACSLGVRDIGNLLLPISASLRTEIVDLLLETGSDPCARDHEGNTPLHTLAWNEDVSENTVGALLSAGANLDDVNSRGETFGSLMASREQPLGQFEDTASHSSVQCLVAE